MVQDISDNNIHHRYDLLCRATHSQYNGDMAVAAQLEKLQTLLQQDLRELARHGSPDDFADLYFELEQELVRFRQCCVFPALANKTVVAFGGAFSAGKSSLINALLGDKLLVTEVDPTTSLPTYLLKGEQDAIAALNLFGHAISLSRDEFLSLTHDEVTLYGSNISQLLQMAMITRCDFPWQNLAFIDTPGYTKHDDSRGSARTDEQLARSQLNAAQAIVWVISAKDGGIKEEDIQFLASLEPTIPRLVVVSRADQVPEADIDRIVETIQQRLQERNLAPLAVLPVSSRKKELYSLTSLIDQFDLWNANPKAIRFIDHFKHQFLCYSGFIEQELRSAHLSLNRLNKILAEGDVAIEILSHVESLQAGAKAELYQLQVQRNGLSELQSVFFATLRWIGELLDMELPESEDELMIHDGRLDLLAVLRDIYPQQNRQTAHVEMLSRLVVNEPVHNFERLVQSGEHSEITLFAHAAKTLDPHVREVYAAGLAMVLLSEKGISAAQSKVFSQILSVMGLENKQTTIFQRIQAEGASLVSELMDLLGEHELAMPFMLDGLILSRLDAPLSEKRIGILSELASLIRVDVEAMETVLVLAKHVLGLPCENVIATSFDYLKFKCWLPFFSQILTAEALCSETISGFWIVKDVIHISKGWSAKHACLVFSGIGRIDSCATAELFTIKKSKLDGAKLSFKGKNNFVTLAHSDVYGDYQENELSTAITIDFVTDSEFKGSIFEYVNFNTRCARSVLLKEATCVIESCSFVGCGNKFLIGGAIAAHGKGYTTWIGNEGFYSPCLFVNNSKFIDCKARLGGGIRMSEISANVSRIYACYFDSCSSFEYTNKSDGNCASMNAYSGGAIFCDGTDPSYSKSCIDSCQFINTTVNIGRAGDSRSSEYSISKTTFKNAFLAYNNASYGPDQATSVENGKINEYKFEIEQEDELWWHQYQ